MYVFVRKREAKCPMVVGQSDPAVSFSGKKALQELSRENTQPYFECMITTSVFSHQETLERTAKQIAPLLCVAAALAGVVVFALLFCLSTLLFVPGLLLTIGAGVAFGRALGFGFGVLWGSVAVLLGAVVACVIAFYLGR